MIQALQEHVVAAVGMVIIAIGTALAGWIKKTEISRMFKRHKAKKQTRKMSAIYRADRALESGVIEAVKTYNADRAIVFNVHNCGKEIMVGGRKFTSATFGYAVNPDDPTQSPFEHGKQLVDLYQQIPITSDYMQLIEEMLINGYCHFRTKDREGTQLYNYYKSEGITDSYIFLAWASDFIVCYWSVATLRESGFTSDEVTAIKLQAQTTRSHCQDAHE